MNFNQWISEITDDLSSLEVATLTNLSGPTGSLTLVEKFSATSNKGKALQAAKDKVLNAQDDLLKVLETTTGLTRKEKRDKIREAKRTLRETERQLTETEKALGIYDPKDLFSKIRVALPTADLVAYSRFELEGDSMNFINSNPAVEPLVNRHHHMVAASQEARKALFDIALKRDKKDGSA